MLQKASVRSFDHGTTYALFRLSKNNLCLEVGKVLLVFLVLIRWLQIVDQIEISVKCITYTV